jgi:methylated-DNA-protein-cysteine methyltransferase-like protein
MKDQREKADFFEQVYQVVRLIPRGRVTTYGAIAAFLGAGGAARTVGWAMNGSHGAKNPVPAHRVVNRSGMLTGKHHFPGPDVMREALESEGIAVSSDRIVNFGRLFWDPCKELTF